MEEEYKTYLVECHDRRHNKIKYLVHTTDEESCRAIVEDFKTEDQTIDIIKEEV